MAQGLLAGSMHGTSNFPILPIRVGPILDKNRGAGGAFFFVVPYQGRDGQLLDSCLADSGRVCSSLSYFLVVVCMLSGLHR